MNRKRRWTALLALTAFSTSCGSPSTSLDTSATNDIDYYWDVVQYDPSPNGYARFQDGWYEGNSISKNQWVSPSDPSYLDSAYSEEHSIFQVEWPKDNAGPHVLYPTGIIKAMEAHYRYEQLRTNSSLSQFAVTSSLLASDGVFCLNQTIVCTKDSQETTETQSFYGPFDGVEFATSWEHLYLKPSQFGVYSFSKETGVLDLRDEVSRPDRMSYVLTSFRLSPDLYTVQSITKEYESQSIEKEESGAGFFANAAQGGYSFSLLEETPTIKVQENGKKLDGFPWFFIGFPASSAYYLNAKGGN